MRIEHFESCNSQMRIEHFESCNSQMHASCLALAAHPILSPKGIRRLSFCFELPQISAKFLYRMHVGPRRSDHLIDIRISEADPEHSVCMTSLRTALSAVSCTTHSVDYSEALMTLSTELSNCGSS